jgi:hypothetical protein
MKTRTQKMILLAAWGLAVTAPASADLKSAEAAALPKVHHFEVTVPGVEAPFLVDVPHGSSKAIVVDGEGAEYTQVVTVVPFTTWAAMVAEKVPPRHDFVQCETETCAYGTNTKISDRLRITVGVKDNDGRLVATGTVESTKIVSVATIKTAGIPAFVRPTVATDSVKQEGELVAGATMTIALFGDGGNVLIRVAE